MSRGLSSPTAPRINRPFFVPVDSTTARDTRLSYRALGLLTYLLDQKEDWQVRSDQLAKGEGREGRGAVRTALRELAEHGYYRVERRRMRSGKFAMGTAISVRPIEQWVRDNEIFSSQSNPAVPVVEQEDGTFLVAYPDGTFGSDGFEPDPRDDEPAAPDDEPEAEAVAEEPPAVQPKPAPAARRRRTPAEKAADDQEKAAEDDQKSATKALLDADAEEVAKWWWDDAREHFGPYTGKTNGYVAMRGMVRRALEQGYTKRQCADALREAGQHLPSAQQWQNALRFITKGTTPHRRGSTTRTPYSDEATWGPQADSVAPSADPDDDVQFGIVERP